MNENYLLDRQFFNIDTRNDNYKKKEENIQEKLNFQNQKLNYIDRNEFNNQMDKKINKNNKINSIKFDEYQIQHKNGIKTDRIGFNSNNKEEIYYKPYQRNIVIENKNLTKLDFIDKNEKTEYYKKIDLQKFDPNINYKDFL